MSEQIPQLNIEASVEYNFNIKKEEILRYRNMYNISGYPEITEKDFERYLKSNKRLLENITGFLKQKLEDESVFVRRDAVLMIANAPEAERFSLLKQIGRAHV